MARVDAVANQKGGVGKTTTAVNLGAALAASGRRVLLLDLDPQGNATSSLGVDKRAQAASAYHALLGGATLADLTIPTGRPGLALVPSTTHLAAAEIELVEMPDRERRLAAAVAVVRDAYDVIVIDCPPSLGLLTVNALVAADGVLVPIQCEFLALEGLMQLVATIDRVRRTLNPRLDITGVVMTMYDQRVRLSGQVVEEVRRYFPTRLFQTLVPRSIRLTEAPSYGQTIVEYDATSRGAAAYAALTEEYLQRLAGVGQPLPQAV
ncbi:MAG: ParA family protein [Chloroflexi bacterium]|nr:ParA family protein [Chloroflexota bacterium]